MKVGDELFFVNVTDSCHEVRKLPILKTNWESDNKPYFFDINWKIKWQYPGYYEKDHDFILRMEPKDLIGYYHFRHTMIDGYSLRITAFRTKDDVIRFFNSIKNQHLSQVKGIENKINNFIENF